MTWYCPICDSAHFFEDGALECYIIHLPLRPPLDKGKWKTVNDPCPTYDRASRKLTIPNEGIESNGLPVFLCSELKTHRPSNNLRV